MLAGDRGRVVLAAGSDRIAVVDDDLNTVIPVDDGIADRGNQAIMPESAVAQDRDGPLATGGSQCRGAGASQSIAHDGIADIERRQGREQMAPDVATDMVMAQFALHQL